MDTAKLVGRMSFEQLVMWANLLHVEGALEIGGWSDDDYPDKKDELRVALVDMIDKKLDEQTREGVPSLTMANRHYLGTLVRDELIEMLNDPTAQQVLMEQLYEKFFEGDKKDYIVKYGEYEKKVSECCDLHYKSYREAIEKLLREMG